MAEISGENIVSGDPNNINSSEKFPIDDTVDPIHNVPDEMPPDSSPWINCVQYNAGSCMGIVMLFGCTIMVIIAIMPNIGQSNSGNASMVPTILSASFVAIATLVVEVFLVKTLYNIDKKCTTNKQCSVRRVIVILVIIIIATLGATFT